MSSSALPGARSRYMTRRAALDNIDTKLAPERLAEELTRLPRDVTAAITEYMRARDISQAALAARIGVSPGRVSQILCGGENLTLRSLATVVAALGARFDVAIVADDGDDVRDALDGLPARDASRWTDAAQLAGE